MRQYAASSDGVLASLLANATQQLGDAISWLGTLIGCVALLLLLLHAVGTTTARTGAGPNRPSQNGARRSPPPLRSRPMRMLSVLLVSAGAAQVHSPAPLLHFTL